MTDMIPAMASHLFYSIIQNDPDEAAKLAYALNEKNPDEHVQTYITFALYVQTSFLGTAQWVEKLVLSY